MFVNKKDFIPLRPIKASVTYKRGLLGRYSVVLQQRGIQQKYRRD